MIRLGEKNLFDRLFTSVPINIDLGEVGLKSHSYLDAEFLSFNMQMCEWQSPPDVLGL